MRSWIRPFVPVIPSPKCSCLTFRQSTGDCVDSIFEKVVAIACEHKIWVVHDLAYADLVFDGYKAPILQVPGAWRLRPSFTLSKSYNMPGWRVGFCCGNKINRGAFPHQSYLDYGIFTPIQVAAITALESDQTCVETRQMYKSRRDVLCKGLNSAGWPVTPPKATMFVWAKFQRLLIKWAR